METGIGVERARPPGAQVRQLRIFDQEGFRDKPLSPHGALQISPGRHSLLVRLQSEKPTPTPSFQPEQPAPQLPFQPANRAIRRFAAGIQLRQQRQCSQPDHKPPQKQVRHRYPPQGLLHRRDALKPDERLQVLAIGKVGTDIAARGRFPNIEGGFFIKGDNEADIAEVTGGKIGNIAFGLRGLDASVFLIAPVAYDYHGIALREGYQQRGINTDYLVTVGKTPMVVCISAEGSQDDAYLDGGRMPLDPDQVKQRIPLLRDKVNAVVATLEAGSAAVATAFSEFSNYPRVLQAPVYTNGLGEVAFHTDLLIINKEEAIKLIRDAYSMTRPHMIKAALELEEGETLGSYARRISDMYSIGSVIITSGTGLVCAEHSRRSYTAEVPKQEGRTKGASDMFTAMATAAYAANLTMPEILDHAVRFAAAYVGRNQPVHKSPTWEDIGLELLPWRPRD